jgi:hypothetical protein
MLLTRIAPLTQRCFTTQRCSASWLCLTRGHRLRLKRATLDVDSGISQTVLQGQQRFVSFPRSSRWPRKTLRRSQRPKRPARRF